MSGGDILELIKIGCARYPGDDEKAIVFVERLMKLYVWEPGAVPVANSGETAAETAAETAESPSKDFQVPSVAQPAAAAQPTQPSLSSAATGAARDDPFDLSPTEYKLWRALAYRISTTGLSPSYVPFGRETGIGIMAMPRTVDALVAKDYVERSGNRRTTMLHVKKWPDGVAPRETVGREDGHGVGRQKRAAVPREEGKPNRRFDHAKSDPTKVRGLDPDHPALTEARTLFPSTVKEIGDSPRVLVSGINQSKLGDRVTKGAWKGMKIYALTLEERATCPDTCHNWSTCYGNNMQWARRHAHGPELIAALDIELAQLQQKHRDGFVVRLHILGDFYSPAYVEQWGKWLYQFPALHVFGYTAWQPDTEIGKLIAHMRGHQWDRFAIRFSSPRPQPGGATSIARDARGRVPEGIVCPAQTESDVACGSCGLCWAATAKDETIVFMLHGRASRSAAPRPAEAPVNNAITMESQRQEEPRKAAAPAPIIAAPKAAMSPDRKLIEDAIAAGKVTKVSSIGMVPENDDIDRLANWMRSAGYSLGCKPANPAGKCFVVNGNRPLTLDELFHHFAAQSRGLPPISKQQIKSALMLRRMGVGTPKPPADVSVGSAP